jgi:solute:Na+ symporter, SSS family
MDSLLRLPDLLVVIISMVGILALGPIFSRKNKSSESYFLAGRSMPGWVVGFSLMATIISSMTFLATPGYTYQNNWIYMPTHFTYIIASLLAIMLFMPFFRKGHVNSAYEYLERRFGSWARYYAGGGFILFQISKAGIVLYAVSLPFQAMTGLPIPWFIIILGFVVGCYTIAGGLEAVIWADFIQSVIMIGGGLVCLPIIIMKLPGGFGQILEVGMTDHKFYMGDPTSFNIYERTFWVMILNHIFWYSHLMCTDQMAVQRYTAVKSDKEARNSIIVTIFSTIPIWVYFTFLGTALYVFYKVMPATGFDGMVAEQALPYFILTQLPVGVAGLVIAGLAAAAMSTLSSIVSATAQTMTTDFYRRIFVKNETETHYLKIGRRTSFLFTAISVLTALVIHWTRTSALVDIQQMCITILSGGLLGLFMIGFLTKRVDNFSALVATVLTIVSVIMWLFFKSDFGVSHFPQVEQKIPDNFMINVLSNTFIFAFAYLFSVIFRRKSKKDLHNLTIWTDNE